MNNTSYHLYFFYPDDDDVLCDISEDMVRERLSGDLFAGVDPWREVEMVSVLQIADIPEPSGVSTLTLNNIRELVRRGASFRYSAVFRRGFGSRRNLDSFFLVTFSVPTKIPCKTKYQRAFEHAGQRYYILRGYCMFGSLLSVLKKIPSSLGGVCRVDYFTTAPGVDLRFEPVFLQNLERAGVDFTFCIHPNLKLVPGDALNPLLRHVLRDEATCAFIGHKSVW